MGYCKGREGVCNQTESHARAVDKTLIPPATLALPALVWFACLSSTHGDGRFHNGSHAP